MCCSNMKCQHEIETLEEKVKQLQDRNKNVNLGNNFVSPP